MARPPSKLFHAVVVVGAALTGCDGKGAAAPPNPAQGSAAPDAGEASTAPDAGEASTAPAPPPTAPASAEKKCPPGSELPFPPCYYIR